jgi:hypothetical protein
MKKILILLVVFLSNVAILSAENSSVTETLTSSQSQSDPWAREAGLRYNMPILAKIYKDAVLFQPTGSLLAIIKDGKCWGYAGLGNSPVGPLYNVTIGYNTASATGFNYQFYDATTGKIYSVVQTVNFTNGVPVGAINAPISLTIQNEILTELSSTKAEQFNVFPNVVESVFHISLNSASEKNVRVNIYNLDGLLVKTVFNGAINGQKVLSVQRDNNLPNGFYLLKAQIGGTQFIQKIVMK